MFQCMLQPLLSIQNLVYNHNIIKRASRALSRAVQLLLQPQQQKQKQRQEEPKLKHVRTFGAAAPAAATAVSLMMSLTLFVEAWAQSAAARRDADHLQVALQVAESGELQQPCDDLQ